MTNLAAIAAIIISGLVWFIQQQRLKLDLMNRRAAIYERMRRTLKDVVAHGDVTDDEVIEFGAAAFQTKFLFGRAAHEKVNEYRDTLMTLHMAVRDTKNQNPNTDALDREDDAKKLLRQIARFDAIFEDAMIIHENPFEWFRDKFQLWKSGTSKKTKSGEG